MSLETAITERVKEILHEKNKTGYNLYISSGLAKSTVYDIIAGTKKRISVLSIKEICSALDITLSEFFNSPLFENLD